MGDGEETYDLEAGEFESATAAAVAELSDGQNNGQNNVRFSNGAAVLRPEQLQDDNYAAPGLHRPAFDGAPPVAAAAVPVAAGRSSAPSARGSRRRTYCGISKHLCSRGFSS